MQEVDVDVVRQAVENTNDLFAAYQKYLDLGGKMDFSEFVNFLVVFGVYVRRGCP